MPRFLSMDDRTIKVLLARYAKVFKQFQYVMLDILKNYRFIRNTNNGWNGREMPAYNDKFELSLEEMDLIEEALRQTVQTISGFKAAPTDLDQARKLRAMKKVLGRLHNQKVFFRPKQGYISG
ncbi:MAG: hypothetical protein AAF718_12050 [Pseudomonadota bacterium]